MKGLYVTFALIFCAAVNAQTPLISAGGIGNAAAGSAVGEPIAPGSLVSIFGTNLSAATAQSDTIPLSNTLSDVTSVTFNGVQAPLQFVSSGQINAQVPWNVFSDGTTSGNVNVMVTRTGGASAPQPVAVGQISPAIFVAQTASGAFLAIAVNPDGSLAAPANAIPGLASHPANRGDALIIYANGLGPVTPSIANGANSLDALRTTTTTPVVMMGGVAAQVLFSGLTPQFPGVNQVNAIVPTGTAPGSAVPLQIQVGGFTTPNSVLIAVQ